MIGQVSAAEEFPAGMAADRLGVVRRFGGEGLGDFSGGAEATRATWRLKNTSSNSRLGWMNPSAHRSPPSHFAGGSKAAVAMKVGIHLWIGRAMDGGVGFEKPPDTAVTPALLEVLAVLSG